MGGLSPTGPAYPAVLVGDLVGIAHTEPAQLVHMAGIRKTAAASVIDPEFFAARYDPPEGRSRFHTRIDGTLPERLIQYHHTEIPTRRGSYYGKRA